MKKRSLLLATTVLLLSSSFYVNAGWLSDKKKELEDIGRTEVKQRITVKLDQYCLKLPFINYYICPPISPDWIDNI